MLLEPNDLMFRNTLSVVVYIICDKMLMNVFKPWKV